MWMCGKWFCLHLILHSISSLRNLVQSLIHSFKGSRDQGLSHAIFILGGLALIPLLDCRTEECEKDLFMKNKNWIKDIRICHYECVFLSQKLKCFFNQCLYMCVRVLGYLRAAGHCIGILFIYIADKFSQRRLKGAWQQSSNPKRLLLRERKNFFQAGPQVARARTALLLLHRTEPS